MVEGKTTSRVPTCVGKVAMANVRTVPTIFSRWSREDVSFTANSNAGARLA
jgi:hypothetical protein